MGFAPKYFAILRRFHAKDTLQSGPNDSANVKGDRAGGQACKGQAKPLILINNIRNSGAATGRAMELPVPRT